LTYPYDARFARLRHSRAQTKQNKTTTITKKKKKTSQADHVVTHLALGRVPEAAPSKAKQAGCAHFIYKSDSDFVASALLGVGVQLLSDAQLPAFLQKTKNQAWQAHAGDIPPVVLVYEDDNLDGKGRVYGSGAIAGGNAVGDGARLAVGRACIAFFVAFQSFLLGKEPGSLQAQFASMLDEGGEYTGLCGRQKFDLDTVDSLLYPFGPSPGAMTATQLISE
jgi:hypothetical protein